MFANLLFESFSLPLILLQSTPGVLFDLVRENSRRNFGELRYNFACECDQIVPIRLGIPLFRCFGNNSFYQQLFKWSHSSILQSPSC